MKKINFKQKKYILPLITMPFVLFMVWNFTKIFEGEEEEILPEENLNHNLGTKIRGDIKDKQGAYNDFWNKRETNDKSLVEGIEDEDEEINILKSQYSLKEQKTIDSLDMLAKIKEKEFRQMKEKAEREILNQEDYKSSKELLSLLQEKETKKEREPKAEYLTDEFKKIEDSQMSIMRKQMAFMDSIEQANNPEIKKQLAAQERLKKKEEDYQFFLNNSIPVSKQPISSKFNTVYKQTGTTFIKAVVDQDLKVYLGSRVRLRLLEDVFVGTIKISKGEFIYAQIAGFQLQRIDLSVVSIMYQDEILPINLSIYDLDGLKGLYVPSSIFREMTKDLGEAAIQGQNLSNSDNSFYMATATKLFQSTSTAITSLMRKNKAKLKYNTFIYLIDEKQMNAKKNNIYKN